MEPSKERHQEEFGKLIQREVQFELLLEKQGGDNRAIDDFSIGLEDFGAENNTSARNERTDIANYEDIPVPCCRIDLTAHIMRCNQLFADLFGCATGHLLQTNFLDIIDNESCPIVEKMLPSTNGDRLALSAIDSQTIWLRRKDQKLLFPAIITVKAIKDARERTIAYNVALVDQTNQHRKIEEVEKIKGELKKKERLKDEFVTVASHELRTPIQPILGFALLAKKGLISEDQAWNGILEQGRILQKLANDILDVSKIDSGNLQLNFTKEKIHRLLELIISSMKNDLSEGTTMHLDYDECQSNLQVEIDRSRIIQVITKILSNAMRFSAAGSIKIASRAKPVENTLEIRVSDTGRGISDEILPSLFEKFVHKGHGDAASSKGTGLGLYICNAIVKLHNGKITAFNNGDGGATFVISLPISQSEQTLVDSEHMNMKGMNLAHKHQLRDALECFDYAIKLNPNSSRAWYNKGMSLFRLGESKEDALLCFQKALEIDPLDAEAWNNKGALLAMLGNSKEALICYIRATELRPGYGKAWQNRGLLLLKAGDKKGAKECFRNAVDYSYSLQS